MSAFSWMAWTIPTAVFFVCIGVMLVAMTAWEIVSPTIERKGWLPIVTTRGDRLFIGLLVNAYINLLWVGLSDATQWCGFILGTIAMAIVMRWG